MGYLTKRIIFLKERFQQGKLSFLKEFAESEAGKSLIQDLLKISYLPNGEVDLSTCSDQVRSFAKFVYSVEKIRTRGENESTLENPETGKASALDISKLMQEYFTLIDHFFEECTGFKAESFLAEDFYKIFAEQRNNLVSRANNIRRAYDEYLPQISSFFGRNHALLYESGKNLTGLKCVIGGTSRFPITAFDGIRKFALYADTIFVPDPILPWIEVERDEERYQLVQILEECFNLLKLKPLVDINTPLPAVVVFPSWEKSLEQSDEGTQDGISELWLTVFSAYLHERFDDESELLLYITKYKDDFYRAVEKEKLFVPPGDRIGSAIAESLQYYKEYLSQSRSKEFNEEFQSYPDEVLLANGIMERLGPQFHVRDNAKTLEAQPLFWLPVHFHYFKLCSDATGSQLKDQGFVNPRTFSILQSLQNPSLSWLGNVPIKDLAVLREENQNLEFRRKLKMHFDELYDSKYEDLDRVVASVSQGIATMLAEHDEEAKKIAEKYDRRHLGSLAASVLTAGAIMNPWLAPFLGTEGLVPLLAKAAFDLYEEQIEKRELSRSLVGILSSAQNS